MARDADNGEHTVTPPAAGGEEAVREQLEAIRRGKRDRVRWGMSTHTRERAISAIKPKPRSRRPSAKSRRRKRHKRLL